MEVLSIPLSLDSTGGFKHVDTTSDEYKAEQVQVFVLTHKGERPVYPTFGVTDPVFDNMATEDILEEFSTFYGSSILLDRVNIIKSAGTVSRIEVNFQ
ncbi:MAG: hypothetical protein HOI21_00500 [Bacteroidetes Order II. Incertae sedis bacterium]|jgi:hypothetical protein|nr:hypothetical protein [Bacteroidetes Order II. bacterium]